MSVRRPAAMSHALVKKTEGIWMIELNSNAIEYMKKLGFRDVVLDAVKYTT